MHFDSLCLSYLCVLGENGGRLFGHLLEPREGDADGQDAHRDRAAAVLNVPLVKLQFSVPLYDRYSLNLHS